MEDQIVKTGELEVPLVADYVAGDQPAAALEFFDTRANFTCFGQRERGNGKHVTVTAIALDQRSAK